MYKATEIEYKRVNQMRSGYNRKYTLMFDRMFNKQFKAVANAVSADNLTPDVSRYVKQDDTQKLFVNLYQVVGSDFAKQTYKTRKAKDEAIVDSWEQYMKQYATMTAGKRITSITGVTKEQIQRIMKAVIEQATDEGLGAAETARNIKRALATEGEAINTWRALRIARTEVMTASNQGSLKGAQDLVRDTGIKMNKVWIATLDDRTRDSHIEMNNVEVDINDDFKLISGATMDGPGDATAPADEVINCRCSIAYRVRRE